jgi:hypothetical protein
MVATVNVAQTISRKPMPENGGSPAMPCATPIVNGLRKAPAKPAPAPPRATAPAITSS